MYSIEEIRALISSYNEMSDAEKLERAKRTAMRKVESGNNTIGQLNVDHESNGMWVHGDGIDCPICKNRGYIFIPIESDSIDFREHYKDVTCECMVRRLNVKRMRQSGLKDVSNLFRFDTFVTNKPFMKKMYDTAKSYVDNGADDNKWLYIGGQSGSGKSHICTAATVKLMEKYNALYVMWPNKVRIIKQNINDSDRYEEEIRELQNVGLLYIDDFFKPVFNANGTEALASAADVRIAYEILNYRYINKMPTIISSEMFSFELAKIDEAIAGRIAEMCAGKYKVDINRDTKRNYRLNTETI